MGTIVCATRGGEGSRAVKLKAIERAEKTGEPLVFLYVVDVSSLENGASGLAAALEHELHWLGRALLNLAEMSATRANVAAEKVIRKGVIREEISRYVAECQASLLMLGAPRGTTANVFGDDEVEKFAAAIQEQTQVPVVVVRPENTSTDIANT